jgi:hypothetical protein
MLLIMHQVHTLNISQLMEVIHMDRMIIINRSSLDTIPIILNTQPYDSLF